jgi:moderate conductance mechanosensitive channel
MTVLATARTHIPVAVPVTILVTIVVAVIARWLLRRIIGRTVKTVSETSFARRMASATPDPAGTSSAQLAAERTAARARTVGALLQKIVSVVIFVIVAVIILSVLGADVGPFIASAGIVGIAIGFGAQSLIKDFLTGLFMIMEDQYGVGDTVDTGQAVGIVEDVGLRVTRLRDDNGVLWYVPNGSITRIGNRSQGWSVARVDVPVAHTADLEQVQDLLTATATALAADPEWRDDILDDPPISQLDSLTPDGALLHVQLRSQPHRQAAIARELRLRVKRALDSAGVPYKQGPEAV